jgi:lipopolysaccharide export system protein LptA
MTARGATAGQVHTILVSEAKSGATKAKTPSVMRVTSGELVYSGLTRQAEFSGGVRADTVDGVIRAAEATVYLQQNASQTAVASATAAAPSLGGSVERMVATEKIVIEQTGRKASGERLVYTASDGLFVLTGDARSQPKMVDAARGTITGAALTFHAGDDSVVVSGETQADKDATMVRGK